MSSRPEFTNYKSKRTCYTGRDRGIRGTAPQIFQFLLSENGNGLLMSQCFDNVNINASRRHWAQINSFHHLINYSIQRVCAIFPEFQDLYSA